MGKLISIKTVRCKSFNTRRSETPDRHLRLVSNCYPSTSISESHRHGFKHLPSSSTHISSYMFISQTHTHANIHRNIETEHMCVFYTFRRVQSSNSSVFISCKHLVVGVLWCLLHDCFLGKCCVRVYPQIV